MRKSIKRNAVLNVAKQILQIIFPIITVPYVTRVLLPENYGKVIFGSSIISYIALIAGLGVSSYAVREGSLIREKKVEFNVFSSQVFTINLVSTILAYVVLVMLLLKIPFLGEYKFLILILSTSVLFTTLGTDWINIIEEDYIFITIRYVSFQIISLFLLFLFVKKPEDYYAYAIITVFSSAGANLLNFFYVRKYVKLSLVFKFDWKRHLIPIFILFSNIIAMTIYVSSDITMLGFFKGDAEVGVYSIATKIYAAIKQIFCAVVVVSIPRLTAYIGSDDKDSYTKLVHKVMNTLLMVMCPLIAGIIVFREQVILIAGGGAYLAGSNSLFILSVAMIFSTAAIFFNSILMSLKQECYILKGTAIAAIVNVILNLFFIPRLGGVGAALTTLISELYVALHFYFLVKKDGYVFFEKRVILLSALGGICVAAVSYILKTNINSWLLSLVASFVLSSVLYVFIHIIGRNQFVFEFLPNSIFKNRPI